MFEKATNIISKARAIIFNPKNDHIFLCNYNGIYLLPGGSLNPEENYEETIVREIFEEMGIKLIGKDFHPLFLTDIYIEDYPNRYGIEESRMGITGYYFVILNDDIKPDMSHLTESENTHNFIIESIPINKAINLILNNQTNNPRNKYFQLETLAVLREFLTFIDLTRKRIVSPKGKAGSFLNLIFLKNKAVSFLKIEALGNNMYSFISAMTKKDYQNCGYASELIEHTLERLTDIYRKEMIIGVPQESPFFINFFHKFNKTKVEKVDSSQKGLVYKIYQANPFEK